MSAGGFLKNLFRGGLGGHPNEKLKPLVDIKTARKVVSNYDKSSNYDKARRVRANT